jgi:arylsulfatase A-like enzyme
MKHSIDTPIQGLDPERGRPEPTAAISACRKQSKTSAFAFALVLALSASCERTAGVPARGLSPASARGMNLLLVTLDTTRADHIGAYGAVGAKTPRLDALAARGLRFSQALTTVPLTTPAHASLLTGNYPPTHGVRNNGEQPLSQEQNTLAELLRERGYRTSAFVSAFVLDRRFGLDQGFQTYDDRVEQTRAANSFGGHNERRADATAEAAIAWLEQTGKSEPFFAWVHFYDAHETYAPPKPWADEFRGREYAGEIAFVDFQLGRLLDALERRGELERTLVAVVADHGESLGEHSETSHGRTIYDAAMLVPLVLCAPGLRQTAVVADDVVSIVDLTPTLLDALGLAVPSGLDGHSLLSTPIDPRRGVYLESLMPLINNGWAPLLGWRDATHKYIDAPRAELFDLSVDPFELQDRSGLEAKRLQEMAAALKARTAMWPTPLDVLVRAKIDDPQTESALAALGYTSAVSPDGSIGVLDPKDMLASWNLVEQAIQLRGQAAAEKSPRKLAEAQAKLEIVLRRAPHDRAALEQMAHVFVAQGRLDDASKAMREFVAIQPSADAFVFLAEVALARGKPEEVEPLAAAAQSLESAHGGARIARAKLYRSQGRYDEAIAAFEEALRVDPVRALGMASAGLATAKALRDKAGG